MLWEEPRIKRCYEDTPASATPASIAEYVRQAMLESSALNKSAADCSHLSEPR